MGDDAVYWLCELWRIVHISSAPKGQRKRDLRDELLALKGSLIFFLFLWYQLAGEVLVRDQSVERRLQLYMCIHSHGHELLKN